MHRFKILKQLFCHHKESYYKIMPASVNCERLQIRCRNCEKVLADTGFDC